MTSITSNPYIDQSPDELCLSIVGGDFDVGPYNVVQAVSSSLGDLSFTARVIGASHIVSVRFRDEQLHEMLACVQPMIGLNATSTLRLGSNVKTNMGMYGEAFSYRFTGTRQSWRGQEPYELSDLIRRVERLDGLRVGINFPFPQGDLLAVPRTVIGLSVDPETLCVVVESAHSYPGQATVMSVSVIKPTTIPQGES